MYTLLTALRSRLFLGLFVFILIAICISVFLGSTALVEQHITVVTYAASATRFFLVFGLIIFVCQHVHNAIESKELEFMMIQPLSRTEFILSYWLSFLFVASVVIIPSCFIIVSLAYMFIDGIMFSQLLAWLGSVFAECILMIAFALVCALILSSAFAAILSSLAFYLLSRMISFFTYAQQSMHNQGIDGFLADYVLAPISILLPRLDLFAQSHWLTYPAAAFPSYWLVQTIIYLPLLLAMAAYDFQRKEF